MVKFSNPLQAQFSQLGTPQHSALLLVSLLPQTVTVKHETSVSQPL